MSYEVMAVRFDTELHARWSVFFDYLGVPYAYKPATFRAGDGAAWTPAFWLPEQRVWFDAGQRRPSLVWARFSAAAAGIGEPYVRMCEEVMDEDEVAGLDLAPFDVDVRWRGGALWSEGAVPGGYVDPWEGEVLGMCTEGDYPYRWTLCPECRLLDATFFGYAERLGCECLDDRVVRKLVNSADPLLLRAYQAAGREVLSQEQSEMGAVLRWVLLDEGERAEVCEGEVVSRGGRLTYDRARQALNDQAGAVGRVGRRSAREVNTLLNRAVGVWPRSRYTLEDLGRALTLAQEWLADPSLLPATGTARQEFRTERELGAWDVAALRQELTRWVGPLSAASGEGVPLVQIRLNEAMGVKQRGEADEVCLRHGVLQAQQWVREPGSYPEVTVGV